MDEALKITVRTFMIFTAQQLGRGCLWEEAEICLNKSKNHVVRSQMWLGRWGTCRCFLRVPHLHLGNWITLGRYRGWGGKEYWTWKGKETMPNNVTKANKDQPKHAGSQNKVAQLAEGGKVKGKWGQKECDCNISLYGILRICSDWGFHTRGSRTDYLGNPESNAYLHVLYRGQ